MSAKIRENLGSLAPHQKDYSNMTSSMRGRLVSVEDQFKVGVGLVGAALLSALVVGLIMGLSQSHYWTAVIPVGLGGAGGYALYDAKKKYAQPFTGEDYNEINPSPARKPYQPDPVKTVLTNAGIVNAPKSKKK